MRKSVCLFVLLIFALGASGCALKESRARMDKVRETHDVTRFEFGKIGSVDVTAAKSLQIAGRDWNFAEFLASVFQEALSARDISTSKLIPSMGGGYVLQELRVAGRNLFVSVTWMGDGKIDLSVFTPSKRSFFVQTRSFIEARNHYESDDACYEGLKAELRPLVDLMLDEAFQRIHEYGVEDF